MAVALAVDIRPNAYSEWVSLSALEDCNVGNTEQVITVLGFSKAAGSDKIAVSFKEGGFPASYTSSSFVVDLFTFAPYANLVLQSLDSNLADAYLNQFMPGVTASSSQWKVVSCRNYDQ